MEAQPTKIETVEAGRGLAALAVVFFHANASAVRLGEQGVPLLSLGEHGVDFFFVLSGFIIFFVHRGDIGRPERARAYALKRAIRLFPLLWLVVLGWSGLKAIQGEAPSAEALGTSTLLYPSLTEPLPLVVWTLRHEAMFYLAFLALVWNRAAGLALFGLWSAAAITQLGLSMAGHPVTGLGAFFLSTYQLDFVLGALVALAPRPRPSFLPLAIALAALIAAFWAEESFGLGRHGMLDYSSPEAVRWTPVLGLAFAALLYGLLAIEERVRVPRALMLLGAASYAIYLVHTPLNALLQHVLVRVPLPLPGLIHLAFTLVGVAGGIALHLLFERPVARFLRRRLLPKPSAARKQGP